ncbi:MAG TPA: glycosyltransferase [Xanthobacteraceae bacterium]|nr:glycosyltransferase [Xanthobacteraceae bacterium]
MRIGLIGKFPPIQGGVSMRTYWAAHVLAARGHEVRVVTNAKEVRPPFRMHMREQDWQRCEASYSEGSVTVHWTDPVDRSQSYIPMASPFVSKLAGIALRLHSERPFDVIHSFYLEPYGVAGHLVAQITGVPHVVRTAGSDAGHLWRHPQLEALYDHVLRSAAGVIAGKAVAVRAIQRGVDPDRIAFAGGVVVPEDVFTPIGPRLDLAALRREVAADPDLSDLCWGEFSGGRPYFGVYGKLGESKGSFALLAAMQRLKRDGLEVGLVALAHGPPAVEERFRAQAREFGLADRILQLPFLPHWRVPEFIRGCLAVCCLEQGFPIQFHSPIMPREVLLCGTCLVAATEVIRKLPGYSQLPHGFGCVAVEDVNDVDTLSKHLAAIVEDPAPASDIGARGREFASSLQRNVPFPQELERTLEAAAAGRRFGSEALRPSGRGREACPSPSLAGEGRGGGASRLAPKMPHGATPTPDSSPQGQGEEGGDAVGNSAGPSEDIAHQAPSGFWLCQLAASAVERADRDVGTAVRRQPVSLPRNPDLAWARQLLAAIKERIADGREDLSGLIPAVQVEIAIAAAERDAAAINLGEPGDPLFRLRIARWGMAKGDLADLICVREPRLRVLAFDFDVTELLSVRNADDLASPPACRRSYMVVFGRSAGADGERRDPLIIDAAAAQILDLSDGTRSAVQIAAELNQEGYLSDCGVGIDRIEKLFSLGLILLWNRRLDAVRGDHRPAAVE